MNASYSVVIGTTSKHKISALEDACTALGMMATINGVKTDSGQNEQPEGFQEGYTGALTRARLAQVQYPGYIAVGIESYVVTYLVNQKFVTFDIACVVIICPDGHEIITLSEGIVFPDHYASIARERGFETTTVGSIIAEETGCDGTDPHSYLTNGRVSRKETLVSALKNALSQLPG